MDYGKINSGYAPAPTSAFRILKEDGTPFEDPEEGMMAWQRYAQAGVVPKGYRIYQQTQPSTLDSILRSVLGGPRESSYTDVISGKKVAK